VNGDADMGAAVQRIRAAFEQLTPADLPALATIYTADARFKDPFNEVQGTAAIRAVFEHMFATLQQPRFVIHDCIVQGRQCFLTWDFLFGLPRLGPAEQCIRGGSHLVLAEDGRIAVHRDYWDAAEELYEKLPLVGSVMRWLKRRASS
jgi:ketosteroid isomerase-like protein